MPGSFTQYPVIYSCLVLLLLSGAGRAVAVDDPVAAYFSGLKTFQANFEQTVVDSNGEQVQHSEGKVWIQKPGRFRWDYRTPYRQLIVADGKRLWTYDEDLQQATVKPVDDALSSTPAMLLSGFRPLSEVMTWKPADSVDGKRWFNLSPRQSDSAVEKVRLAFDKDQLAIIEVNDSFGNRTRIIFTGIVRNRKLDSGLFELQLPADTDIIGATP
ncbi:MAG: outer membrane lipoprotein chaperone LolA [Gammaproteobacteria bacterium]|nr:MAG: outer membrane lipoprotein chaperone LolA [Gammaproteobacteria bacterium]